MVCRSYKASIPGSLMLLGEHAVLHGSSAIVSAIKRYITATLIPHNEQIIVIDAAEFGKHQVKISDFSIKAPWQFVLTAISSYIGSLPSGFKLQIKSQIPAQLGLGSSAAVTVATLSVLEQWLHACLPEPIALVRSGREIIQRVQGLGSGADIAASVYGGVVAYNMEPLSITKLKHQPPLVVVYSGSKTPTCEVVKKVADLRSNHLNLFTFLYNSVKYCVRNAIMAINQEDWLLLGKLMNIHQGLQDAMEVNNEILSELIFDLRQHQTIYGAKISGSGLGDCVIGLGQLPSRYFPLTTKQRKLGVQQIQCF